MVNREKKIREIRKVLMSGKTIRIGTHTKDQLIKRGYTRRDILACILNGSIVEVQQGYNRSVQRVCPTYVIEGKDIFNNPFVIVISDEGKKEYSIVTVMPPMDKNRFRDTI